MSTVDKRDYAAAWRFAETLVALEEGERIEKLSEQDLHKEMLAVGLDPNAVPSLEELIARGEARKANRRAEIAPVLATDQVAPRVPVVAIPLRRPARIVWLLAASFFALALVFVAMDGPHRVVALFRGDKGDTIGPDRPDDHRPASPTTHELAEKLRDEAVVACGDAYWGTCRDKLDQASKLDPAGDTAPRVRQARADIEIAIHPKPPAPDKPRLK